MAKLQIYRFDLEFPNEWGKGKIPNKAIKPFLRITLLPDEVNPRFYHLRGETREDF